MPGDGAYFSVEYDQVARVAGQLAEVTDTLVAALGAAGELQAVDSPGFSSVPAALGCAQAWLDEVRRLAAKVDAARGNLDASMAAYRDTDASAGGSFSAIDVAIDVAIGG
jgi:hypothetical protein